MQTTQASVSKAGSKGKKIIFSIVLLLLISIAGAVWYWNTHKKAIIRHALERTIKEKSGGLYKIKYEKLELDEIAGSLSISGMTLSYDSNRYAYLKTIDQTPSFLLNIFIPGIYVSGVKTPRALIDKEIVGRKLEIKNPVIDLTLTGAAKDSSQNVPAKEVYEQLLGNMDLIQIDTVIISGAQITTTSNGKEKTITHLNNITLSLVNVKVDSLSSADTTRLFFARELNLACEKIAWSSPGILADYSADSVLISSASHTISIKSFRAQPTLGEEAFVKNPLTGIERHDFSFKNIHISDANIQELLKEKIMADSMFIGAASFKIYKDLAVKKNGAGKAPAFSPHIIKDIPVLFQFRKIKINNAFVEYKEKNNVTRLAGKARFYTINAAISNCTNNKTVIAANNIMTAYISSRFLNKVLFITSWRFYLLDPGERFEVKGSLEQVDATVFNALTIPMGSARISRGMINRLEFDLRQNGLSMRGSVKVLYKDFKIDLLKKDKETKKLKSKTLTNIAANIIIKNDNPSKKEDVRIARVQYDHNAVFSMFDISWKTLLKGVKETVGIKN